MNMPKTFFDVVQTLRPKSIAVLNELVSNLNNNYEPIQLITPESDRFKDYVGYATENYMEEIAKNIGVSVDFLRKQKNSLLEELYALEFEDWKQEYHCFLNFILAGKKTFFVNNQLCHHLLNTEINVPTSEIQLPFSSCQFVFAEKEVINAYYAMNVKDNPNLDIDYSAPISVFITLYNQSLIQPDADGRELLIYAWQGKLPDGRLSLQRRSLFLGHDWNLEQSLKTDWNDFDENLRGSIVQNGFEKQEIDDMSDFYTDGLLFYRLILNAILYCNSEKSDVQNRKSDFNKLSKKLQNEKSFLKKEKIYQELSKISKLDYQEVGANIQPIIIKKDNNEKDEVLDYPKLDKKILYRFMVRGHWRRQKCGVGLTETKLIWIKPYIKGDNLAEMINKPYLMTK